MASIEKAIRLTLDKALGEAIDTLNGDQVEAHGLSDALASALDALNARAQTASAVFTNIVTCLAIKVTYPDVDMRYHQVQIQDQTDRPAGFNFRGVSEDAVYPWLNDNRFEGAKSGWQTRTLERPRPYTLDYAENIALVKQPFLNVFSGIEEQGESADAALKYLIYKQVVKRELMSITLAVPKIDDVAAIAHLFQRHFFRRYGGAKGASRLPVLALHALYSIMVLQLKRYEGKSLRPLQLHSAADSQTGSVGDIEVSDNTSGEIFEAVEVKHNLPITEVIAADLREKVMSRNVKRYYVLTTLERSEPDAKAKAIFDNVKSMYGCQVIANGVLSTIRYYLRLLDDPSAVFPAYVALLTEDKALGHEHRSGWNEVVLAE